MQLHRRANLVNKTFVFQWQIYNIVSSLSTADTQFQTILTSLQGEVRELGVESGELYYRYLPESPR